MTGVLFPAYQKLYSALSSLDRFSKENNFFDNVSCLDVFFSEFRNITFAIQKEVKNTERESRYVFTYNFHGGTETIPREAVEEAFGSDLTRLAPPQDEVSNSDALAAGSHFG